MDKLAEPRKRLDSFDLYQVLNNFFDDNKSSNSLPYRWVAQQVLSLKKIAWDLHANGVRSFEENYSSALADLRLSEIEAERSKLAKEESRLSEEADRIKRATAKTAA